MPYGSSHNGESITWVLNNVVDDCDLTEIQCVVRDNASNISLGVRFSKLDNTGCFCHTIHLIVTHAIQSQSGVKLLRTRLRNLVKKLQTVKGKNRFKENSWSITP